MPPEAPNRPASQRPATLDEIYERVRAIGEENERLLGDLIAGETRFRRLAKAVWQVQEDERRRLARELHDGIGQTLTALKNHLEWIEKRAIAGGAGEIREAAALAAQALDDTRELSRLLRPPVLDDLGLPAALTWLGRTVGKRFGLEVAVTAEDPGARLPTEVETVFFRIAQEALTNAAKHARATRVEIGLVQRDGVLELAVADDGVGFEAAGMERADGRTGVGLRGMRDRVELFEGALEIRSRPGAGTTLVARLPAARDGGM